jgi:primary-amine oxidase
MAKCHYDIIAADRTIEYHEAIIDLEQGKMVENKAVGKEFSPSLTL